MNKLTMIITAALVMCVFALGGCGAGGGGTSGSSGDEIPTGVIATAGNGTVTISWNTVISATSYNIYWSVTSGVTRTSGIKITSAARPYTHISLTNGTTYYYVVTSVNSDGESSESSQVTATPNVTGTIPSAPTGATATAGNGTVTINWNTVTNATSYNIYWSITSGVTKTNGLKITSAARPYTHTGLTNGIPYYYVVTAVNSIGESSASSQATATPNITGTIPSAPTGATATAGNGTITINWNSVTSATSYNIYWSTTSGVAKTSGTKITNASRPYTHTSLTNGTPYYYVVTAVNSIGESSESSQVTATPTSLWTISSIDTIGNVGKYTSIAVDANQKEHISYYDITNEKLKYATNLSGSWVVTTVANAPTTAYSTSIAVDTNGKVHIAYEGTSGDMMYATNSSGNWATAIIYAGAYSSDVALALDTNNKVHISYFVSWTFDMEYATNASGSWVKSIIVNGGATGPLPSYSTSIDLDSNNKVHISYYDDSAPDSIKYITNASGSWQITQIDTIGYSAGWETSLVVDSGNKVHITYYEWNTGALEYATNSSGAWQTSIVDSISDGTNDAFITVDANRYVHISYGSSYGLKYTTNSSGSWVVSTVDGAGGGSSSSIAVDANGGIHISYYGNSYDLKYATK